MRRLHRAFVSLEQWSLVRDELTARSTCIVGVRDHIIISMEIVLMVICFIVAYVIGAVPFAYIAGKTLKGIDIRDYGSGNVGATNVLRTLGRLSDTQISARVSSVASRSRGRVWRA